MSAYNNNPQNVNNLRGDKFKLVFQEIPHVSFFTGGLNLPGLSQNAQQIENPINRFYLGSNKVTFETFNISFRVDEDLKNYREIFNWMKGITAPTDTDEFKKFIEGKNKLQNKMTYNVYSDATLVSLTNSHNKNINIFFRDMMPISLSGLDFSNENNQIINATASFNYLSYDFED